MFQQKFKIALLTILALCTLTTNVYANNVIDVQYKILSKPNVAVYAFKQKPVLAQIIKNDLFLFNDFELNTKQIANVYNTNGSVSTNILRNEGVNYVLVGMVRGNRVIFDVINTADNQSMLGGIKSYQLNNSNTANVGHRIADDVYKALTGKRSAFSGKVAYVTQQKISSKKSIYKIIVSSTSGQNKQQVLSSYKPIRSLSWSANGKTILFVSYETGIPQVYSQNIYTGKRTRITKYKGTHDSPSFSPDGKKIVYSESRNGNFDIFEKNLVTGIVKRITRHRAYDTDPSYAPDGSSIIFTSDRTGAGKPQIYQYFFATAKTIRLTYKGSYNTRARFNKTGDKLVLIHNYLLAVLDVKTKDINIIGTSRNEESPNFAPHGNVIIFTASKGRRQYLQMVSIDGKKRRTFPILRNTQMREAAWTQ